MVKQAKIPRIFAMNPQVVAPDKRKQTVFQRNAIVSEMQRITFRSRIGEVAFKMPDNFWMWHSTTFLYEIFVNLFKCQTTRRHDASRTAPANR